VVQSQRGRLVLQLVIEASLKLLQRLEARDQAPIHEALLSRMHQCLLRANAEQWNLEQLQRVRAIQQSFASEGEAPPPLEAISFGETCPYCGEGTVVVVVAAEYLARSTLNRSAGEE